MQEYEKKYNYQLAKEQEICCDENTPCVPTNVDDNSYNKKAVLSTTPADTTESLLAGKKPQLRHHIQKQETDQYKGENTHSKNNTKEEGLDIEYLKPELKAKIKEEIEKCDREQNRLLKQNKQTIINFLLVNKDSIRVEDLKIYEPVYKCYREKGNCKICNSLSNIICISCSNYKNEIWLCTSHWEQHAIEKHTQLIG